MLYTRVLLMEMTSHAHIPATQENKENSRPAVFMHRHFQTSVDRIVVFKSGDRIVFFST